MLQAGFDARPSAPARIGAVGGAALIAYAQLRPGPGFSLRMAALYYAQRLASPYWLKTIIARLIARGVSLRHPAAPGALGLKSQCRALAEDGIIHLPGLVPPARIRTILAYLEDKPVRAPDGRMLSLHDIPPDIATADYPLETVLSCPAVVALINADAVLAIAGGYLGCRPTLSSVGLRWSFPSAGAPSEVQRFHRDPDDWRFLKLFVYLTDVDEWSGPHVYVRGSHRTGGSIRARPYDRRRIEDRYGASSITPILGREGTAFMADTSGIHMGMPAQNRPRLLLAAQYSLLPVFAFRYAPVTLTPSPAVDRYVNRLLIA
jgi:hypothetical protein